MNHLRTSCGHPLRPDGVRHHHQGSSRCCVPSRCRPAIDRENKAGSAGASARKINSALSIYLVPTEKNVPAAATVAPTPARRARPRDPYLGLGSATPPTSPHPPPPLFAPLSAAAAGVQWADHLRRGSAPAPAASTSPDC
jgi:hypothetical protein